MGRGIGETARPRENLSTVGMDSIRALNPQEVRYVGALSGELHPQVLLQKRRAVVLQLICDWHPILDYPQDEIQ
jgi:hypothetical protein